MNDFPVIVVIFIMENGYSISFVKNLNHTIMCMGIKANKPMIGNLIVYIATKCSNLHLTKLLKLLYIIDEEAVKLYGSPITWLEYEVWKKGPVSTDVYHSKNVEENRFSDYIRIEQNGKSFCVIGIREPDLKMFSRADIEIIDNVLMNFGHLTSEKLIEYTHRDDSLWSKVVKDHNIKFSTGINSDYTINFPELIKNEPDKLANYYSALDSLEFQASII